MTRNLLLSTRIAILMPFVLILAATTGCPDPYSTYSQRLALARHLAPYPTSQAYDALGSADNHVVVVGSGSDLGRIGEWGAMTLKVDGSAATAWYHRRPTDVPNAWTSVAEQGGDIVAIGHNSGGVFTGRSALGRWNAQTGALKDFDEYGPGIANFEDEYFFYFVGPGPESRCIMTGQSIPASGSKLGMIMAVDAIGTVKWQYDSTFVEGENLPASTPTVTVAECAQQISEDALLAFGFVRTDFSADRFYDANWLAMVDSDGEGLWLRNYVVGTDLPALIFESRIQALDGGGFRIVGTNSSPTPCPVYELLVNDEGAKTGFRQIPTSAYALNKVLPLPDGGFLVCGNIREITDEPYTPLDAYVAKIGADGITLWERRIGQLAQDEYGDAVSVLADGNYALIVSVRTGNNLDARMLKLTPDTGDFVW